ncbi:hypothetical protein [Gordonia humi]|uniref:Uncharacterized protein n=1 Tax=Gordonia humi TaxID=686429 RepID=A0A840F1T6_9ACTN|nr:hypothetical protein [Gordonia humi]MBB4137842.1 hypothetical protein [Gordonia humi]
MSRPDEPGPYGGPQQNVDHYAQTMHGGPLPERYPQQYQYPHPYAHPPQRGSSVARGVVIGLAIACVVALVVAGVVLAIEFTGDDASNDTATATETVQQQGATEVTTTVPADPEADAAGTLASTSQTDTADVRAHHDHRWAAQISAKWPGVYAEGRAWDSQAILAEYRGMASRYPNVKLLRAADWPVFSDPNWWIIVSAQSFSTPESALAWCRAQSLDHDHCFAKYISSSDGPEGSTRYQ